MTGFRMFVVLFSLASLLLTGVFCQSNELKQKSNFEGEFDDSAQFYEHTTDRRSFGSVLFPQPQKLSSDPSEVPGIYDVGCGYDVTSLTALSSTCLFDLSTGKPTTWSNPFYQDIQYQVPYGFYVLDDTQSTNFHGSLLVNEMTNITSANTHVVVHDDNGFLGFGSSHSSETVSSYYNYFYERNMRLSLSLHSVQWFRLEMNLFPLLPLNAVGMQLVSNIPTKFDPVEDYSTWMTIFTAYGTHLTISADLGGVVWAEDWYQSCVMQKYSEKDIKTEISHKYDPVGMFSNDVKTQEHTNSFSSYLEVRSESQWQNYGGTETMSPVNWPYWTDTVKYNCKVISRILMPLDKVLPLDDTRRDVLHQAIKWYRQLKTDESNAWIAANQPPIDKDCPPLAGYRIKQLAEESNDLEQSVNTEAGVIFKSWSKEPGHSALSLTTPSGTTWTDPYNDVVKEVPVGVVLTSTTTCDKTTDWARKTMEYNTQAPLGNKYTAPYVLGEYLTWMYGKWNSVSMLQKVLTWFTVAQDYAAFVQAITGRYRLEVPTFTYDMLSSQAQEALSLLPVTYDAHTYEMFVESWGDCIATSIDYGGVVQMEIERRPCLQITIPTLDQYYQSDLPGIACPSSAASLTKANLDNYHSHRQDILCELRGGNPEVEDCSNVDEWFPTVGVKPTATKVNKCMNWADIVQDAAVKANIQKAVKDVSAAWVKEQTDALKSYVAPVPQQGWYSERALTHDRWCNGNGCGSSGTFSFESSSTKCPKDPHGLGMYQCALPQYWTSSLDRENGIDSEKDVEGDCDNCLYHPNRFYNLYPGEDGVFSADLGDVYTMCGWHKYIGGKVNKVGCSNRHYGGDGSVSMEICGEWVTAAVTVCGGHCTGESNNNECNCKK